ncbi:hypothetical protein V6Z11_D09G039400 [Gossypium hirsutum]
MFLFYFIIALFTGVNLVVRVSIFRVQSHSFQEQHGLYLSSCKPLHVRLDAFQMEKPIAECKVGKAKEENLSGEQHYAL